MKKIITLLLSVAIVISLFSMIQISAASVPEDGTELAITKADITLIEADGSGDFACSDANSLSYISANDSFSFTVDFAKAGVYKAVAPIAAPAGGGTYEVYVDDALAYTAKLFTASGTNQWELYAENSIGYFEIKSTGSHTIKYVFTATGFNFKLPTISYAGETMPEWETDLKRTPTYEYDAVSSSPAKSVHICGGHYYALRINIDTAFRGFGFSMWTTGSGYNGHAVLDMSVYKWDEDFGDNYDPLEEFSYASDPIATKQIATTQNGDFGVVFESQIPAGEYLIVIDVVETKNDDPNDVANKTPYLHIKTGKMHSEYVEDMDLYFEAYTNATEYALPPDRWAAIDIYTVKDEAEFYELGDLLPGVTPEPTATPDPSITQAPTTAPTVAPTTAPTTAPTQAPVSEEKSGCGSSAMVAQIMLVLGASIIIKKKNQ